MTMGEDFNYANANMWFKNMDKIRNFLNNNQEKYGINVMYSTPSCYIKSLNNANITWPSKQDDFFPYASDPHAFWTGYFTSRPSLKGMIRAVSPVLTAAKQVAAREAAIKGSLPENIKTSLNQAKKALGVAQHHDAVTGTA